MNNKRRRAKIANARVVKIVRSAAIALIGGIAVVIAAWIICNCFMPLLWALERI